MPADGPKPGEGGLRYLRTPARGRRIIVFIKLIILSSPVVLTINFIWRLWRGDYPWDGDGIAVPIVFSWAIFFPLSLWLLVKEISRYRSYTSLFNWSGTWWLRSLLWTSVTIYPLFLAGVGMFIDGLQSHLYWVSGFYLCYLYCLLLLRASVLNYSPHEVVV